MKTKQKHSTPKLTLDNFNFSKHAIEQLQNRFGMTIEEIKSVKQYFKSGNTSCIHKVVRNKVMNYPHQVAFYNEKYNLILMADTISKDICSALYLDGREGYNYQR
jgi:hypothetical protein